METLPQNNQQTGHVVAPEVEQPASVAHTGADFETWYQRIGRTKGEWAAPEAKRKVREFWRKAGLEGARWLLRRLDARQHAEICEAVPSLLSSIGESLIPDLLAALNATPIAEKARVVLRALSHLQAADSLQRATVLAALEPYLRSSDTDLREEAYYALRCVGGHEAQRRIEGDLKGETDASMRTVMEDALSELSA